MSYRTQKVIAAINDLSREQFRYGVCDCCTFAARVVGAFSDVDVLCGLRYDTEEEAAAVLKRYGGLIGAVNAFVGSEPCPAKDTQDGDPLLLRTDKPRPMELIGVRLQGLAVYKTVGRGVSFSSIDDPVVVCGWRV